MSNLELQQRIEKRVGEIVGQHRARILDLAEAAFGNTEQWPFFRSKALRLIGDRGLEGELREAVGTNFRIEMENAHEK